MRKTWPLLLLLPAFLFYVLSRGPEGTASPLPFDAPVASPETPEASTADLPDAEAESADPPPTAEAQEPTPEAAKGSTSLNRSLVWIVQQQNADGSWGEDPVAFDGAHRIGRTGMTSLALLVLLGNGYSHLSRDDYGGIRPGLAVKNALKWLVLQEQREDGSFPADSDPAIEQALASLAICEGYGMSTSLFLKEPAQHAIEALHRLEAASGGWGDAATNRWGAMAYASEGLSEIMPEDARDYADPFRRSLRGAFARSGDFDTALAFRVLSRKEPRGTFDETRRMLLGTAPSGASADAASLYRDVMLGAMVMNRETPEFRGWHRAVFESLRSWQQPDGSYPGATKEASLVRTCFSQLVTAALYTTGFP